MYYEFKDSIKNIVYWSNSAGSLHHNGDYDIDEPKDLPEELQEAFENLWYDGSYLMEFNGHYGVAIEITYDEDFADVMGMSYEALKEYGKEQAKDYAEKFPKLDVIFGDDTTHWSDGSVESNILIFCPWNMGEKDFLNVCRHIEKTQYNNINSEKIPEEKTAEVPEAVVAEAGCKKVYSFDNFEGDKGVIFATSREEAIAIYKENYPDRQIVEKIDNADEELDQYCRNGCYLIERCKLEDTKLVVVAEW